MATETITLTLDQSLERGKCYIISGTLANLEAGGEIFVRLGNSAEYDQIQVLLADGDFDMVFDYNPSYTFYKSLFFVIENGGDNVDITNLSLKLDPECEQEYCSECFNLDNCGVAPTKEYLYLEWTNNDDGFGMNYSGSPLVHSLWIKGGLRNADYPYQEDYFSTSGGFHFPVYVDATKTVEMWVEDIPEYIHDALRLGVVHDEFTVNGVKYSKADGGYSPDWDTPNSLLAPVVVKLRESLQDTKNENC